MPRDRLLRLMDRLPRLAGLLGLLGLVGVAGVVDANLFRLSALSFLSFACLFRFFRRFGDPAYGPRREHLALIAVAVSAGVLGAALISASPLFGFLGFAGFLGLSDPPHRPTASAAAWGQ
jgi:hypothetical protein